MQKVIIIVGLCILIVGCTLTLLDITTQGSMSMSGILDRLRQSYPNRSGKELTQALHALPGVMIATGVIITAWGFLSKKRSSITIHT